VLKIGRWIAKCSVSLLAGVVVFGIAASAATIPKNIAAMFNDDEMDRPFVMRPSATPASAAKRQRQEARKSAKPRLLVSAARSELRSNPVKYNHAKPGEERLSPK
jgi:hypothetical protein